MQNEFHGWFKPLTLLCTTDPTLFMSNYSIAPHCFMIKTVRDIISEWKFNSAVPCGYFSPCFTYYRGRRPRMPQYASDDPQINDYKLTLYLG